MATPTVGAAAWPAAAPTCAVCVLYARDESYDDEGAYRALFSLYEHVPTDAVPLALAKLQEAVARNEVRHFSVWSAAADAVLQLRIPHAQARFSYAALQRSLE